MTQTLKLDPDNFYELDSEPQDTLWVQVGTISVYIKHEDEGVVVDLFAAGAEDRESFGSTYMFFQEATDLLEELEEELDN